MDHPSKKNINRPLPVPNPPKSLPNAPQNQTQTINPPNYALHRGPPPPLPKGPPPIRNPAPNKSLPPLPPTPPTPARIIPMTSTPSITLLTPKRTHLPTPASLPRPKRPLPSVPTALNSSVFSPELIEQRQTSTHLPQSVPLFDITKNNGSSLILKEEKNPISKQPLINTTSTEDLKKLTPANSNETSKQKSSSLKMKKPRVLKSVKGIFGKKENIYQDRLAEYMHSLTSDSKADELMNAILEKVETSDTWTSRKKEYLEWSAVEVDISLVEPNYLRLLDVEKAKPEGFRFEFGNNELASHPMEIFDYEKNIPYYFNNLYNKELVSYVCDGEEDKNIGPICVVFDIGGDATDRKSIIYTKKGDERLFIDMEESPEPKEVLKYLKNLYPETIGKVHMSKIVDPELNSKYVDFEKSGIITKYKIGILYAKDGQTTDDEMFSNGGFDTPSSEYNEFLAWIGTKVQLKGFEHFRGGLDVKNDSTGTHSVYTTLNEFEIMFHVSTLLPFQPDDLQRVERKRHLGNDMVMIIFKEGNTPFNPNCIATQFIHCFIVIEPVLINNKTFYKIAIANKPGVLPYGPFLKSPPLYEKGKEFREFLLTKIINAERAAMHAPDFKLKMVRTRNALLEGYAKEFLAKKEANQHSFNRGTSDDSSQSSHSSSNLVHFSSNPVAT